MGKMIEERIAGGRGAKGRTREGKQVRAYMYSQCRAVRTEAELSIQAEL